MVTRSQRVFLWAPLLIAVLSVGLVFGAKASVSPVSYTNWPKQGSYPGEYGFRGTFLEAIDLFVKKGLLMKEDVEFILWWIPADLRDSPRCKRVEIVESDRFLMTYTSHGRHSADYVIADVDRWKPGTPRGAWQCDIPGVTGVITIIKPDVCGNWAIGIPPVSFLPPRPPLWPPYPPVGGMGWGRQPPPFVPPSSGSFWPPAHEFPRPSPLRPPYPPVGGMGWGGESPPFVPPSSGDFKPPIDEFPKFPPQHNIIPEPRDISLLMVTIFSFYCLRRRVK